MEQLTKLQKLEIAYNARVQEVEDYQINIDNYSMAIEVIDSLDDEQKMEQSEFRSQLVRLLESEKREQGKAKIMLSVIERQLSEVT